VLACPGMRRRVVSGALAVAAASLLALPAPAWAGRSHYGWLYGSEVSPERGVEIETWILERNDRDDEEDALESSDETALWWAPVIGITEHVELAIPVELVWEDIGPAGGATTQIARWGAEVRVRPHPTDPVEAGPVTTLFRAGAKRVVNTRDGVRGEADAIVAVEVGRVHAEIDLGVVATYDGNDTTTEIRPAAGISVRTIADLRLGAETYGEIGVTGNDVVDWLAVGPNLGWTHGRFWLAATVGIGLFGVTTAPRINFAVAF
jgi:hypothetical protein